MKIHIHPLLLPALAILCLWRPEALLWPLVAVLIHEGGHLIAARCLGIPIAALHLSLPGARLVPANPLLSYRDEWLLCAAGPAANLLTVALWAATGGDLYHALPLSSVGLGLLNLLPIATFDGGRMTFCALAALLPHGVATRLGGALSFLCLFLLWALSVYLLLRRGASLSLFVFTLSVFSSLFLPPTRS